MVWAVQNFVSGSLFHACSIRSCALCRRGHFLSLLDQSEEAARQIRGQYSVLKEIGKGYLKISGIQTALYFSGSLSRMAKGFPILSKPLPCIRPLPLPARAVCYTIAPNLNFPLKIPC